MPAKRTYDVAQIVGYVDTLRNEYRECSDLQRRNLTVLREERRE